MTVFYTTFGFQFFLFSSHTKCFIGPAVVQVIGPCCVIWESPGKDQGSDLVSIQMYMPKGTL